MVQGPLVDRIGKPFADANPSIAAYNLEGFKLIPAVNFYNKNMKIMVGNFIY